MLDLSLMARMTILGGPSQPNSHFFHWQIITSLQGPLQDQTGAQTTSTT